LTEQDLLGISNQRYNKWQEKRPIVCSDQDRYNRAAGFLVRKDLSPSEKSACYFHELTGCDGLEFVVFSNAKLENSVRLPKGVILVPCFLANTEGMDIRNQLLQLTMKMEKERRFIYDGWIPIIQWDEENVRQAIRNVDEALSIFCLNGSPYFEWELKYPVSRESLSIYNYTHQHLQDFESISKILDTLNAADRMAIYRSLAWLSQSLRLNEPAARLFFSILAIESLATYIELEAPDESPLIILRSDPTPRADRLKNREQCIENVLSQWLKSDPAKAVTTAYFDCVVGIKRRLKTHLEKIFAPDNGPIDLLFENKIEGKSLYDLRNDIAHGTTDALSEAQIDQIRQRVWDAEKTARKYILATLKKALGAATVNQGLTASVSLDMHNMVPSSESMYQGPTNMAVLYS